MRENVQSHTKKLLSIFMALMMVLTVIPVGMMPFKVSAADSFTVTVKNSEGNVIDGSFYITMDDKTETATSGIATFNNVDDGQYDISVAESDAYWDATKQNVSVSIADLSTDIIVQTKANVSGTVVDADDENKPIEDATISVEAITAGAKFKADGVKTDADGKYSFVAQKGAEYKITASKTYYEDTSIEKSIDAITADCDFSLSQSEITISKSFTAGEKGNVQISGNGFDANGVIKIKPTSAATISVIVNENENYHIKSVVLTDITESKNLIEYNNNGDSNAAKNDIKSFDNKSDTNPDGDFSIELGHNYNLEVVFEINSYDVTIGKFDNGTASFDENSSKTNISVVNGSSCDIYIKPVKNYYVYSVTEGFTEASDSPTNNGFLKYTCSSVNKNMIIAIDIKKCSVDEKSLTEFAALGGVSVRINDKELGEKSLDSSLPFDSLYKIEGNKYFFKKGTEITIEKKSNGKSIDLQITDSKYTASIKGYAGTPNEASYTGTKTIYVINKTIQLSEIQLCSNGIDPLVPTVKNIEFIIDNTAPSVLDVTSEWGKDDCKISGTVADNPCTGENDVDTEASGIDKVVYSDERLIDKNGGINDATVLSSSNIATLNEETGGFSFTVTDTESVYKDYYIYVIDKADNITESTATVKIDKAAPIIDNINVSVSPADKILNILSFGAYSNDTVKVEVTAHDEGVTDSETEKHASGLASVSLYCTFEDKTINITPNENNPTEVAVNANSATYSFEINKDFSYGIYATATDKVGNTSKNYAPSELESNNTNMRSDLIVLEDEAPKTTATVEGKDECASQENNINISSTDAVFTFTAYDESGLFSAKITDDNSGTAIYENSHFNGINADGSSKRTTPYAVTGSENDVFKFIVNTSDLTTDNNGKYSVTLNVTDNCGNTTTTSSYIYKDLTFPTISGFDFNLGKNIDVTKDKDSNLYNAITATDYGFYFSQPVTVTVYADDKKVDKEINSGIKSITYKTVDINGAVNESTVTDIKSDKDGNKYIQFTIPAEFKGQVYAYATDNVNNAPSKQGVQNEVDKNVYDSNGYTHPNGSVIESEIKHNSEEHLAMNVAPTTEKTASGSDLYNANVPVNLVVTDSYSGIRSIEWSVKSAFDTDNNKSGTVEINNNKGIKSTGDVDGDSAWVAEPTTDNIVCKLSKTIVVRNNSNNISVNVKMTDRAGNVSTKTITFSIDKTAPVIALSYADQNQKTGNYNSFYNKNRIATITVTERNFDAARIVTMLENIDNDYKTNLPNIKNITKTKSWKANVNNQNPDASTYTYTIKYKQEGKYKFNISYNDLAMNASNKIADQFVLDKTLPSISYEFKKDTALNGNYYNANRTATVTVVEHNFNSNEVENKITVKNNGGNKNVTVPSISKWKKSGKDTYKATIEFNQNAEYTVGVDYTDKAGNKSSSSTETFSVDKVSPVLDITGLNTKKTYYAYKDNLITPVLTITDADGNLDTNSIVITLKGRASGHTKTFSVATDSKTKIKNVTNGVKYTIGYFNDDDKEIKKTIDDIYTMKVSFKDLSGNSYEKEMIYSVNRYGSTFNIGNGIFSALAKNDVAYVKTAVGNVFLTEVNADDIKPGDFSATLIYSTASTKKTEKQLVYGKDYEVTNTNTEKYNWNQYQYKLLNEKLFADDGTYELHITTKDYALNTNKTDSKIDKVITFVVDNNAPVIDISKSFEQFKYTDDTMKEINNPAIIKTSFDGEKYKMSLVLSEKELSTDAINLDTLKVTYNDQKIDIGKPEKDESTVTYTFYLSKNTKSGDLKISVDDYANNPSELTITDLLVNSNFFVRLVNNTVAFVCTIIGVLAVLALVLFLIFFRKKDNEDE